VLNFPRASTTLRLCTHLLRSSGYMSTFFFGGNAQPVTYTKTFINHPYFGRYTMEVKILEEKKRRLVFELHGANHGICNALKNELWNDSAVTLASYAIEHPLVGIPKFVVETSTDVEPKAAVKKAISRLRKQAEQFRAEVKGMK
jgi:DNA-directed RNA polymerase subunit L